MNPRTVTSLFVAAMMLGGVLPQAVCAALPSLEQPWLGRFAVGVERRYQFLVSSDGTMEIELTDKEGNSIGAQHKLSVRLVAEEVAAGAVAACLSIDPESLVSTDPATDKLRETTIRGKMAGNDPAAAVSFEATIELSGGAILIGGRITDAGPYKNPVRLSVHTLLPPPYAAELQTRAEWDKKQERDFEKRTKRDLLELKHIDGSRSKQSLFGKIDANSKEINGTGISAATFALSIYQGMSLEFIAGTNSTINLWNAAPGPLSDGFGLLWRMDAAKDPGHNARLAIRVK